MGVLGGWGGHRLKWVGQGQSLLWVMVGIETSLSLAELHEIANCSHGCGRRTSGVWDLDHEVPGGEAPKYRVFLIVRDTNRSYTYMYQWCVFDLAFSIQLYMQE